MSDRRADNRIVLVIRDTRLDELVRRFNTQGQARFYVEHLGADFADYQAEDQVYKQAMREAEAALSACGRVQVVNRSFVPNFIFGERDTVVALGQDGLVANVLKYLDGQLLVGVNPDPARWEGVLLPFVVRDLDRLMPDVFARRRPIREVTMAQAALNTGETLCAVNDLFIGPCSHTSARYVIRTGDRSETHSSSGIIVSTGLGSTGWLRSILAGAIGVAQAVGGGNVEPTRVRSLAWDAAALVFSVREPWPSRTSAATITFGEVTARRPLVITSQMPEGGVIFSDGVEADRLQFNSGACATIGIAQRRGYLVA